MLTTIEAIIEKNGQIRLLENIQITKQRRALVTILDEETIEEHSNIISLLSEQSLAIDWNRPEEDEAWAHLQSVK